MAEAALSHRDVQPRQPERARSHSNSSRGRQVLNLIRREGRGPPSQYRETGTEAAAEVESPKTPIFQLGMPMLPSMRLQLPHLTRRATGSRPETTSSAEQSRNDPDEPPSRVSPAQPEHEASSITPGPPRVVVEAPPEGESRISSPSGDTLTNEPREFRSEDAQARGAIVGDANETSHADEQERPKRFLGCLPRIRSRRVRAQIIRSLISGLFLTFLLVICRCRSSWLTARTRANRYLCQTLRSRSPGALRTASSPFC